MLLLTSGGDGLGSMPFTRCSYWYMPFAGTLDGVLLFLGVALYQYTASTIEQCDLVAILLIVPALSAGAVEYADCTSAEG